VNAATVNDAASARKIVQRADDGADLGTVNRILDRDHADWKGGAENSDSSTGSTHSGIGVAAASTPAIAAANAVPMIATRL
jgi:hypothetical protein